MERHEDDMPRASGRGRPRSATTTIFSAWIDAEGHTRAGVASSLKVTRGYVDKLARGEAMPSLAVAAAIEKLSKGRVTPSDWISRKKSR